MTNPYERIQQYLDGELTGEELRVFEGELQSDQALAEELAMVQEVRTAVNFNHSIKEKEEVLSGTLTKVGAKYFQNESNGEIDPKIRPIRRILAIAASFLLLIGLVSLWYANQQFSAQALAETFVERPISDTNMGEGNAANTLKNAKTAYFAQDYTKAKTLLNEIEPQEPMTLKEVQVFLAYIALEEEQYELAITRFSELLDQDLNLLPNAHKDPNKLRWNRLMAYVGNGQTSTEFFKKEIAYFVDGKSDFYRRKATALTTALESPWQRLVL